MTSPLKVKILLDGTLYGDETMTSNEGQPADQPATDAPAPGPRRIELSPRQRRVLGVLVEKSKTSKTPDAYPLSLNALTNGCNQKSNRAPQMSLNLDEVQDAVDELRHMGAALEVQGGARVPKYRHQAYDWLNIDKFELAVLGELLLRGEQTVGELRARANRMSSIADLAALRPLLKSLMDKGFVLSLTPAGRGQVVTHNMYKDREMDGIRGRVQASDAAEFTSSPPPPAPVRTTPQAAPQTAAPQTVPLQTAPSPTSNAGGCQSADANVAITLDMFSELQVEVAQLQADVAQLRRQLRQYQTDASSNTE